MTKLAQKLIELNYLSFLTDDAGTLYCVKRYFFHNWIIGVNRNRNKIEMSYFGTHTLNFIAYIRYKKELKILKELELCQD